MIRRVRCSDDQGPFCFLSYFPEKMRAMVPTIYANTVNPIQNNAMMENGIMAFTVTSFPSL